MEALAALSLAGNIIQFVDFISKLVSKGQQINHAGSTTTVLDLDAISTDLKELSSNLVCSEVQPVGGKGTCSSQDEKAIEQLASKCKEIAQTLTQTLEKLKGKPNPSKWKSFRQALKSVWKKEEVDTLAERVFAFRNQLEFRILVGLRATVDVQSIRHDERFNRLDESSKATINAILSYQKVFKNELILHAEAIAHRQNQSDALSRFYHMETLGAIEALKRPTLEDLSEREADEQNAKDFDLIRENNMAVGEICGMLWYQFMHAREEAVPLAHQKTFEWMLNDTATWGKTNTCFVDWIRQGKGCYWIYGKAGSGKSTLMKYLASNLKVLSTLKTWSGASELVTARFYFWQGGTQLQRSQVGLLRSLLHAVIEKCPSLLPVCFPDLYEAARQKRLNKSHDFTLSELKMAFNKAIEHEELRRNFCFFIDGIDEFEGDHATISEFFKSIGSSPRLKIIVSSRPIPACVDIFSDCSGLRLQDLTQKDITIYINDTIGKHRNMQQLLEDEPVEASKLVEEISKRASGVFLWVTLVVRSLMHGLRNYDTVHDLQQRLKEFPPELRDLYRHMLGSMEPLYLKQASQIFQIVLRYWDVQGGRAEITALQLYFATNGKPERSISSAIQVLSAKQRKAKSESMEGRLRSRCCGLLEVQHSNWRDEFDSPVRFFHRTVLDYLKGPDTWEWILSLTADDTFDPDVSILASCLMQVKTNEIKLVYSFEDNLVVKNLLDALRWARRCERNSGDLQFAFIDELARLWVYNEDQTRLYREKAVYLNDIANDQTSDLVVETQQQWDKRKHMYKDPAFTYLRGYIVSEANFIILAVNSGLHSYVCEKLRVSPQDAINMPTGCQKMLWKSIIATGLAGTCIHQAMDLVFDPQLPPDAREDPEQLILTILTAGADIRSPQHHDFGQSTSPEDDDDSSQQPDEPLRRTKGDCLWVIFLKYVDDWTTNDEWTPDRRIIFFNTLSRLTNAFLLAGADGSFSFLLKNSDTSLRRNAPEILYDAFDLVPDKQHAWPSGKVIKRPVKRISILATTDSNGSQDPSGDSGQVSAFSFGWFTQFLGGNFGPEA